MDAILAPELAPEEAEGNRGDSIFALSSGAPPVGIAVIRVSGPGAGAALEALAGGVPEPRRATLRTIGDPATGEAIDRGVVLFFPGPASFTGEDVAEFQLHGGRAVVSAVLETLGRLPGFRPAEPGEFTRRAFVAGRMDLTEAEGLADLVAADTSAQRRAALEQMGGSARRRFEAWATGLTRARGLIEAELDFSEEEGLGSVWAEEGRALAAATAREMEAALAGFDRARAIREGLEIVLLGPVNVGKSTLLNAIAGRDVAIVSEEAGTTRDLIEVAVDVGGYRATLVDSAGLREAEGAVEREGIRRARDRAAEADLVLWLSDGTGEALSPPPSGGADVWTVATKADLRGGVNMIRPRNGGAFVVSAKTGEGVSELIAAIAAWAAGRDRGEPPVVTRERHRAAVREAVAAIARAVCRVEAEFAAEDLRQATNALGRVTGRIDVESVLDVVFNEFCIGK
jgi:tRNA modification GTPase